MKVSTSSWLNFGRPASSGRGSAVRWNFLAPRYYGQRAVFVCLHALFSLLHAVKPMPEKAVKMPLIATVTQTPVLVHWSVVHAWPQCCLLRGKTQSSVEPQHISSPWSSRPLWWVVQVVTRINWKAPWKNRIYWYISLFRPSLNHVPFPMFCLLVEGECQILVF